MVLTVRSVLNGVYGSGDMLILVCVWGGVMVVGCLCVDSC